MEWSKIKNIILLMLLAVNLFLLVLVAGAVWPLVFRPMSKWGKGKK